MSRSSARVRIGVLLLAAVAAICWGEPQTRAADSSYNVTHTFSWSPSLGFPVSPPTITWIHFEHAWADDGLSWVPPACNVNPAVQPSGFAGYGTDWLNSLGQAWNIGSGGGIQVSEQTQTIYGVPNSGNSGVSATSGDSFASASTYWWVNQSSLTLYGSNSALGSAHSNPTTLSKAYAFSESKLQVGETTVNLKAGHFGWESSWYETASGTACAFDPINVSIFDDAGNVALRDTPVHIEGILNLGTDDASKLGWANGRLFAQGVVSGQIHASVQSQYVSPLNQGTADLVIDHGAVIQSNATGIFAGLLPPVGTPGTFDVPFVYQVGLDFNYPELARNMTIEFGGGGGAVVPEPGTVVLLIAGGLAAAFCMWRRKRNA